MADRVEQFTPGPWRIRIRRNYSEDLSKVIDTFYGVAAGTEEWRDNKGHFHPDDARYAIDETEVVVVGCDEYYYGGIERIADARLIAAAPELLAALRHVDCYPCHLCGLGYGEHKDDCYVGAAIRKATVGESV